MSLTARSTSATKGVVISEKYLRDKEPDLTPTKTGKLTLEAKKKGTTSPQGDKKKVTLSKAIISFAALGEGTSIGHGAALP